MGHHTGYAWDNGEPSGAFHSSVGDNAIQGGSTYKCRHIWFSFSASWSNSLYGSSSTVVPKSQKANFAIRY